MRRSNPDRDWDVPCSTGFEGASLCVLMDIREELRTLNRTLAAMRKDGAAEDLRRIERRLAGRLPLTPRRKSR